VAEQASNLLGREHTIIVGGLEGRVSDELVPNFSLSTHIAEQERGAHRFNISEERQLTDPGVDGDHKTPVDQEKLQNKDLTEITGLLREKRYQEIFQVIPITLLDWFIIILVSSTVLFFQEVRKLIKNRFLNLSN